MFVFIKRLCLCVFITIFYTNFCKADCGPNINKYVWKAALEVIKPLPLSSADPFGGVIITNWFNVNEDTRYKLDIYVLSGILNSQSVRVSVFKQVKNGSNWKDTAVNKDIANNIEETILNEAKKLRLLPTLK